DGQIAVRGITVRDALDVAVDPEDFLHHDQAPARPALGFRAVGGEFVAVRGGQLDHLPHVRVSFGVFVKRKVYFVLWHNVAVQPGAPGPMYNKLQEHTRPVTELNQYLIRWNNLERTKDFYCKL